MQRRHLPEAAARRRSPARPGPSRRPSGRIPARGAPPASRPSSAARWSRPRRIASRPQLPGDPVPRPLRLPGGHPQPDRALAGPHRREQDRQPDPHHAERTRAQPSRSRFRHRGARVMIRIPPRQPGARPPSLYQDNSTAHPPHCAEPDAAFSPAIPWVAGGREARGRRRIEARMAKCTFAAGGRMLIIGASEYEGARDANPQRFCSRLPLSPSLRPGRPSRPPFRCDP